MLTIILILLTIIYFITGMLFFIGLSRKKHYESNEIPFVSVVIAVRNEEEHIKNIMSDLLHQNYPKNRFEVIFVDDNSEDNTKKIIKDVCENESNIKLIELKYKNENLSTKKLALSEGIKNSYGEIILTTDADCRLKSLWIESMVKNFTPECGMVVGFSQINEEDKEDSLFIGLQALDFLSMMCAAAGATSLGYPLASSGQNLAYRKEAFQKVDGFSKIKHRISGDDTLLLQIIKKHTDFKINFSFYKDSFVSTHPLKSLKEFLNQRTRWASNALYQRKMDILFFIYLIVLYLTNVGLIIFSLISVFYRTFGSIPIYCLLSKWIIDFIVLLKGTKIFNRPDLLKYFFIWEIFQPFYFAFVGIKGSIGKFTWKGRKYKKEKII